jgi:hypothetical protein
MSYDCHLFVDSLFLTEALISNAVGMRTLPALWLPVSRRTSLKCWAIWTETPEYSGRSRAISPMRSRVLAGIDRGTLRWSYPRWSSREDIARH